MNMLIGCLVLVAAGIGQSDATAKPIVSLKQGQIQGFEDTATKGNAFYQFNAIPYGRPPVGELRLKNPEAALSWNGILDGSRRMPECSQLEILTFMKNQEVLFMGQEDCLFLSISAPKTAIQENLKLPVMVYIHGGGFLTGSGNMFQGHEFMNEDIILVTINYRLGTLGFLSTEDSVVPGNIGMKDQTLALKWVKDNIHQFGGDPEMVTIFGLSAGGASTHFHVLSPSSRGLFKRAILQSGTMINHWARTQGTREIALQVGASLGCLVPSKTGEALSKELLKCLQSVDTQKLVEAAVKFIEWSFLPLNFAPCVDGDVLPDSPELLLRQGKQADVDLIIGVTRDEGAFITNSIYSMEHVRLAIEKNFEKVGPLSLGLSYQDDTVDMARRAYELYVGEPKATTENGDQITKLFSDSAFIIPAEISALFHSETGKSKGKNVYFYQLDHKGERSLNDMYAIDLGKHWVAHADEAFYQFPMEAFGLLEQRSPEDAQIRDNIIKLWTNFAATGNPTPDDSLGYIWQPFTKSSPVHLSIKNPPSMENDSRKTVRDFWTSLSSVQNQMLFGDSPPRYELKTEL